MNPGGPYQRALDSDRILNDSATQPAKKATRDRVTNADKALLAQAASGSGSGQAATAGFPVADIGLKGGKGIVIHALTERLLPGETKKGFVGYRTLYHALAEANQSDKVTTVFGYSDGRFRVFDTDRNKHSFEAGTVESITPREAPKGSPVFLSIRLINLESPKDKTPWGKLVQLASSDGDYLSLVQLATGLLENEVNAAASFRDYVPGRLNFQLALEFDGVTGYFMRDPANLSKLQDTPVFLQATKVGTLPVVAFAIGKTAISSYAVAPSMFTIVHEATHAALHLRALEVVKAWRATGSKYFDDWLKNRKQDKSIDGKVLMLEEYEHILETVGISGGVGDPPTSGTMARIESFMSVYHHPDFPFETSTRPINRLHFKEFGDMHDVWPNVHAGLKKQLLERLRRYCGGLDSAHQTYLKEYLNGYISANPNIADFHDQLLANLP